MSVTLTNFVFEVANFLLLAAALGWVLFKPVRAALERERERHAKEREESQHLRAQAQELEVGARRAREAVEHGAEEERRVILQTAHEQAAAIIAEAKSQLALERKAFERELAAARQAEVAAVTSTIGSIAAESVARLLATLDGPPLDAALVRAACAELRTIPKAARGSVIVESAHALDAESKRLLAAELGAAFESRVVGELGAGVRVRTEAGQVDASALSLARYAAHAIEAHGLTREGTAHG